MTAEELQKRLRSFAYRIVTLCEALPSKKISGVIEGQLLRSASSAADESLVWLESINDLNLITHEKLTLLLKEADELVRILAATRIALEKKESSVNLKS
jgi:hypothetical protein